MYLSGRGFTKNLVLPTIAVRIRFLKFVPFDGGFGPSRSDLHFRGQRLSMDECEMLSNDLTYVSHRYFGRTLGHFLSTSYLS